jgi:FeoB-associated Cys-rich membrane protein
MLNSLVNPFFTHWQEMIVGVCVLFAFGFLLRAWFFTTKKNASCGGCNDCGGTKKSCDSH